MGNNKYYVTTEDISKDLLEIPPKQARDLLYKIEEIKKNYKDPIIEKMCITLAIHTFYTVGVNTIKYYDD